ncbi:hypothetical protein IV487_14530 [Enterococcus saccharolyticus]|uniref:hypothetical protein n=1 Tax=Enterococcus saccharolyticus TaxID=41997 RepID=UPI001E555039|nr:hypothetical protein [Enterococcus saccharolyticus]MCD5003678.1 hypothetical protein [Enterococcus saccharolyticus]
MKLQAYSERFVFAVTYWVPKLIVLQFIWLLHALPIVTIVRASQSLLLTIHRCQQTHGEKVFSIYRHIFQTHLQQSRKRTFLLSIYSFLLVFDIWFFFRIDKPYGYILSYSLLIASYFILLLFIYQTLLNDEKGVRTRLIAVFYLFFKFPRFVVLHLLLTVGILLGFLLIGPIYAFLLGISLFFFLHNQIFCLKVNFYEKNYQRIH